MEKLIRAPRMVFAGEEVVDVPLEDAIELLQKKRTHDFSAELPLTDARRKEIKAVQNTVLEFGETIGIDLTDRLLPIERHHILEPADYNRISGRETTYGWAGYFDIALKNLANHSRLLGGLCHETLHMASHTELGEHENVIHEYGGVQYTRISAGRMSNRFKLLNEAITELTNIEIQRTAWMRNGLLEGHAFGFVEPGYEGVISFIDCMFKDMAEKQGRSYKSVLRDFQRSYFLGNGGSLQMIKDTYGEMLFERLARVDGKGLTGLIVDYGMAEKVVGLGNLNLVSELGLNQLEDWFDELVAGLEKSEVAVGMDTEHERVWYDQEIDRYLRLTKRGESCVCQKRLFVGQDNGEALEEYVKLAEIRGQKLRWGWYAVGSGLASAGLASSSGKLAVASLIPFGLGAIGSAWHRHRLRGQYKAYAKQLNGARWTEAKKVRDYSVFE
ncbi:hypothetical protein ACFL0V_02335 [Nanoarchaeota archaeon]